jgi:hypothetical protein
LRPATVAVAALLIGLLVPSVAAAETPFVGSQDFSAADQYVEQVPTSRGSKPATPAKPDSKKGAAPAIDLPPAVQELGGTLKQVATSPSLGAPERSLPDPPAKHPPSVPGATVSAVGDAGGGGLLWLLLSLVAVSGAVLGSAGHRHRSRTRNAGNA